MLLRMLSMYLHALRQMMIARSKVANEILRMARVAAAPALLVAAAGQRDAVHVQVDVEVGKI